METDILGDVAVINPGDKIYYWTVLRLYNKGSYLCRCQCGEERVIKRSVLIKGGTKSCGCMYHVKDLRGQTFGELTPLKYIGDKKWLCKCSCGEEVEVASYKLSHGMVTSCGHSGIKGKTKDLRGMQFGELTAIEYKGNSMWLCKCSCGKETTVHRYSLLRGATKSCGHLKEALRERLEGQQFGELTVLEYVGYKHYKCKCSCGNEVIVWGANLKNGHTRSCGCKTKEFMINTFLKKYGEVTTRRFENPRDMMLIKILNTKKLLREYFDAYEKEFKNKPSLTEVAETFLVTREAIKRKLIEYELTDRIDDSSGSSVQEKKLYNHIRRLCDKYGYTIQKGNRAILEGMEIDIFIPELKLGIEFNGSYWHSAIYKDKNYHYNKSYNCAKQGYRLIHIFDYELWDRDDVILNYIDDIINPNKKVINARDCVIKILSTDEVKEFLERNHIQGYTQSQINLGLSYKGKNVGVMTFSRPRFSGNADCELIRLCFEHGVIVNGGAQKLFKYAVASFKGVNSIITYCDISKFTGGIYHKLGFEFNGITEPNYKWVSTSKKQSLSRYQTTKSSLIAKGLGDINESEDDIMSDMGYYKVYDCGNSRYIWKRD